MSISSLIWVSILLIGLSELYGNASGVTWRDRQMPIRELKPVPSERGTAAKLLLLVKKRSASNGQGLDDMFKTNLIHRERRQHLQGPVSNQSLILNDQSSPRNHGTFNQDTYACDEIMSRQCQKPSDCDGCLGLFTCKMPQGTCDFKGVSKHTGLFFQSLKGDQETNDGSS